MGKREQCFDWARRALAIDPEESSILYNVACAYAISGRLEESMDCLEKVLTHGAWYKHWAANDSDLDSLRTHARFKALLG
jgi:adenylate cyclase